MKLTQYAKENDRFIILEKQTKTQYYELLNKAKIIFNCSMQDWVSFTLLEATTFQCDICYPNFRAFPEFISPENLYKYGDVYSAVVLLQKLAEKRMQSTHDYSNISWLGTLMTAYIVVNGIDREYNIWYDMEKVKRMVFNDS